ncbi:MULTISPECIES: EAL domain-containing protein [Tenebrionibacter/Tenebrionicola group]|jgi:EAL domain-containing protein (putative c-di-GMP-specific phosphodiesterase class I)/GGDEF domain-containing protein|uniref:Sensor domain-containing phosphodiesterase n=2 Tax=Tenebrionibacter/Tenebrionicola group TaxID=2969848 RepID=A0A8K0V134_9ENTR|nr:MULTISPECIES: EAL domain-containing protein [Tenebrionibacter/Tenebrionicola group]MBK4715479.1 sensor domain-containing phosphodiesterase [Tenebrionibacter intestinalis]MBV5094988.1 sensor domain-containing phosphodiesterase [Tenebrionicola larvae]
MQWSDWYQKHKNRWWCLPLILPILLQPLAVLCNVYTELHGVRVVLFYMPPALMMALMLLYGWAALPGIAAALVIRYLPMRGEVDAIASVCHYLFTCIISWGGYRLFVPRRNAVSFGYMPLSAARLFWLVFCQATIFFVIYQGLIIFEFYSARASMLGEDPLQVSTLINYQSQLVSSLVGIPFFYFILRALRHPPFARHFISRMRMQFHAHSSQMEVVLWLLILLGLVSLMLLPLSDHSTIFNTNYTLTLMLPVMLWGAMRFGFLFIIPVWTLVLIILSHYYYRYLLPGDKYDVQMAITSSCYAVFSFTIYLMAEMTTHQRTIYEKVRNAAFIDPVVQMPNLRALTRDLNFYSSSTLCLLNFSELDLLGQNYGVLMRVSYKQQLANGLQRSLQNGESLYHLSNKELVLRLSGESGKTRVEELYQKIRSFRFLWDGRAMQLQVGMSYCYVRSPVSHHYLLLGELGTMADFSLSTNRPESLQVSGARHVQNVVKQKVYMMNRLQKALDDDGFQLMAQRVEGIRGDGFYEILLRMKNDDGSLVKPDHFLPIAHEFGLSSRIDSWVLESALEFISKHREALPGIRFSINLTLASVCRAHFATEVYELLQRYDVQAWQLMFEINESSASSNMALANQTIYQLRQLGCRIAIDGFGTGYASYVCLREMNVDMLKLDGSFIRNIASSSVDYQLVESICQLARMKKMQVVAEFIETQDVLNTVKSMGIDYMQGHLISHPRMLESLV